MIPDPMQSKAIIFGMYSGGNRVGLKDLPAVKNNLSEMHRVLTDGTVWKLPLDRCLFRPEVSSSIELLREIRLAATSEDVTDTLLVYYAGHGVRAGNENSLYLAISDMHHLDEGVEYDKLRTRIRRSETNAKRVVVIVDCCYSGVALDGELGDVGGIDEDLGVEGACVLTASAANRKALAPPGERFTAFTGALLESLLEGVSEADQFLTMSDVFNAVNQKLKIRRNNTPSGELAPPLPKFAQREHGGNIYLCQNRSYIATGSSPAEVSVGANLRRIENVLAVTKRSRFRRKNQINKTSLAKISQAFALSPQEKILAAIGIPATFANFGISIFGAQVCDMLVTDLGIHLGVDLPFVPYETLLSARIEGRDVSTTQQVLRSKVVPGVEGNSGDPAHSMQIQYEYVDEVITLHYLDIFDKNNELIATKKFKWADDRSFLINLIDAIK